MAKVPLVIIVWCQCWITLISSHGFPFSSARMPFPETIPGPALTLAEMASTQGQELSGPPQGSGHILDRSLRFRNYFSYVVYRWPNNRIPYTLDYRFTPDERVQIAQAFHHIQQNSCVHFASKTGADQDFVHIYLVEQNGCSADDHYQKGKGQHVVRLKRPICMYSQVIVHELLHLLGVGHEHQRPDRDQFVEVNWSNILPEMAYNFFKDIWEEDIDNPPEICYGRLSTRSQNYDSCTNGLVRKDLDIGYDYQSIMHYQSHYFAINQSEPTLISKKTGVPSFAGDVMSLKDVEKLQKAYSCEGNTFSGCGGHVNGESGSIQAQSQNCEWIISVDDGFVVELSLETLLIPEDCLTSNVSIFNANKELGPHLGTFCQNPPSRISSLGNALTVVFTGSLGSHFKASWRKIKAICCSRVNFATEDHSSVLATRFRPYLGTYVLVNEEINGAPHYVLEGNPNVWLARFLPTNTYTSAAWIVSHRLVGNPGTTNQGEFYLGGNVQCPHLISVLFYQQTGLSGMFLHESGFKISCVRDGHPPPPSWPFVPILYPVLSPFLRIFR